MELQRDSEGRWIGDDGFVVPSTFAEFAERFPQYGTMMARSILKNASHDAIEDLSQDIMHRLIRLCAVERFDPAKLGGANTTRFFYYIGRCARNTAISRWRDDSTEPALTGVGIDNSDLESTNSVTEEHIHASRVVAVTSLNVDDKLYLDGLRVYLTRHDRLDLIALMDALLLENNQTQAAYRLGMSPQLVSLKMKALRRMAKDYEGR